MQELIIIGLFIVSIFYLAKKLSRQARRDSCSKGCDGACSDVGKQ
ncbi:MAG: hypothetical protein OEY34_09630 [Cyclobacteriaceae bacterium]|nr:hypothetical protein [Cyclobacteriaceae bacterium]